MGESVDAVMLDERGGGGVLRGQGIGRGQENLGAARFERAHEARSFGGNVQARGERHAFEGPFTLESFADEGQNGHLLVGPFNGVAPLVGEVQVFYVVLDGHGGGHGSETKEFYNAAHLRAPAIPKTVY